MYTSRASRLAGARRMAALLTLATAAACSDGVTDGTPSRPGGNNPPPDTTPVVASVEITPGTLQLPVQGSRALSATVRTPSGRELTGRLLSWTSSDPTIVRVDINGNATALRVGTAVITATLEGKQGQSTIEVITPSQANPVATVRVVGHVADLEPGESRSLSADLRSAGGAELYDREITWSSSDSTVVRVAPGGQITGVKGGTATITATSEGKSGALTIVIPQWLTFDLGSVSMQGLPVELEMSADTTDRTENGMVVTEYRLRLTWGRLWISTIDWRYRQRYDLQLWRKQIAHLNGNTITGVEQLIDVRTIRDEGMAEEFDVFTGEPLYASTTFGGHGFRVYRTQGRSALVSQRLPGEGGVSYDLRFTK